MPEEKLSNPTITPIQGVEQIYLLNLNVILGVCFALLATRAYGYMDSLVNDHSVPSQFILRCVVVIMFLLVTHIEYYWFLKIIVRTVPVIDVLAPLILGAIQAIAIYYLADQPMNAKTLDPWWAWEGFYALFGIVLLINSWLFRKNVASDEKLSVVESGLKISIGICSGVSALFLGVFYGGVVDFRQDALLVFITIFCCIAIYVVHNRLAALDCDRVP